MATSSTTATFLYDGDHLAIEYNASGGIAGRYFFGPGADEPIFLDQGGSLDCNNTRFLHLDARGSMIAANDCSGNRTTTASYDEYGIPASTNWGRFQYTGQMYLPEIGLDHYKARMYSPPAGRFLQTDPIGYGDGMNWYAYTHNDPVNGTDPSGMIVPTQQQIAQMAAQGRADAISNAIHNSMVQSQAGDMMRQLSQALWDSEDADSKLNESDATRGHWECKDCNDGQPGSTPPPGSIVVTGQRNHNYYYVPGVSIQLAQNGDATTTTGLLNRAANIANDVVCSGTGNAVASSVSGTLAGPRIARTVRMVRGAIAVSRAVEGAEVGADVGAFGGPIGFVAGAVVGAGIGIAVNYAQEKYCGAGG